MKTIFNIRHQFLFPYLHILRIVKSLSNIRRKFIVLNIPVFPVDIRVPLGRAVIKIPTFLANNFKTSF